MATTAARDRSRRWGRIALATTLVASALAPFMGSGTSLAGASPPSDKPSFKHLGQIVHPSVTESNDATLLLDSEHERAYALDEGSPTVIRVFDLSGLETLNGGAVPELDPIEISSDEVGNGGVSIQQVATEKLAAIDPARQRIMYLGSDGIYEVDVGEYDPATGEVPIHKWVIYPDSGNGVVNNGLNAAAGISTSAVISNYSVAYDPGNETHPERLYVLGQVVSPERDRQVVIQAYDATPGEGPVSEPEDRLEWVYSPRSCVDLDRGSSPTDVKIQGLLARASDWLYTYCNGSDDGSARGVARVNLASSNDTVPDPTGTEGDNLVPGPDPQTEQFFPGVTGEQIHAQMDVERERVYFGIRNVREAERFLRVFDGRVGETVGGAGAANQSIAAYIGEIALIDKDAPTREGFDPVTGRWYIQTADDMRYQEGSSERISVAQAIEVRRDDRGVPMAGGEGQSWRRLYVEPSVPGARGARIYVFRDKDEQVEVDGEMQFRCPLPEVEESEPPPEAPVDICFDVYEDTSPLATEPPPFDEKTLNQPEGPGRVGVYSSVTTAYGLRLRAVRGLSTAWPNGVGGLVTLEGQKPSPPENLTDYLTDPFAYHAGDCGDKDREITFSRVRDAQLGADLFAKRATATALAVDPDALLSNGSYDTQTRDDYAAPDECTTDLARTFFKPLCNIMNPDPNETGCSDWEDGVDQFADGLGQALGGASGGMLGEEWPYPATACEGDESPPSDDASLSHSPALPGASNVACAATGEPPVVEAHAEAKLLPTEGLVSVEETETRTEVRRRPGEGIIAESTVIVRGISIAGGQVHIDEMILSATAEAQGYVDDDGKSTAHVTTDREFLGMTVGGERRCDVCDPREVVGAINTALGGLGYARAADHEQDVTLGTAKGTRAVVQKNLLLQDADAATNRDFSSEWPGLEIVIYRDGVQRGAGRWTAQIGGVFAQSRFEVVEEPADSQPIDFGADGTSGVRGSEPRVIPAIPATAGEPETITVTVAAEEAASKPRPPARGPGILKQIREGLARSAGAALLMAALWSLVFAPAYLARRRGMLKQLTGA